MSRCSLLIKQFINKKDCKLFSMNHLKVKNLWQDREVNKQEKKKEMKTSKGFEETVSIQSLALDLATDKFSLENISFVSQSY